MRFLFDLILNVTFNTILTRGLVQPTVKSCDAAMNACWGEVREQYGLKPALRDSQVWA